MLITHRHWVAGILAGMVTVGCGASEEDARTSEASQALAAESVGPQGQQAVYAASRYLSMPDVAFTQYASATLLSGGSLVCGGAMVGPNVYMTAAHCNLAGTMAIRFRTYRGASSAASDTEDFTCRSLLQTFDDTDLTLFFCEPNAAGENPGDKYGYLHFDTSAPTLGMPIYSVSGNPVVNGSIASDARIYATGNVTQTNYQDWFVPNNRPNTGIGMNLWGDFGVSGSPNLNAANHRVIVGPVSTADGGWARYALSMRDYFRWGVVDSNNPHSLNDANVAALGLVPARYDGLLDKNLDFRFDIQTDLERLRGESRRDWYWLGFDSERRNALWDPIAFTTIDAPTSQARIRRTTGTTFTEVLAHRKLNLRAGTYRVSLMTFTNAASTVNGLWVSFKSGGRLLGGEFVPTTVGAGWQMHTLQITAPTDNAELIFGLSGTADVLVSNVSVVRSNAVMDLDTFDKRVHWRNDNTGARAQVVPDGRITGTPNWALRVPYDAASPGTYPVRNRQLALVGGRRYRICFDHRRDGTAGTTGELRLASAGQVAASVVYTPGASWATSCTPTFTAPSDNNMVQIRANGPNSAHFVDNIAIQDQ